MKRRTRKIHYGRIAFLIGVLLFIPLFIYFASRSLEPLKLKSKEWTVQMNEDFDPYSNIASLFMGSRDDVHFEGQVQTNLSEPEDFNAAYIYKGVRYPFVIHVADTKAPEFKLKDVSADTSQSLSAEDFVETITDSSGYSLRLDCPDDITSPGEHTITITAKDNYGNEASKTAKLTRIEDKKAPEIAGFQDTSSLLQGDAYVQQQYEIKDDLDPSPIVHIDTGQLNTQAPGSYPVTYTVRDRSGNEKTYTQTVEVTPNPDFGKKICYLTFDDGPSENTIRILDILKRYDVPATFFVTAANPDYYHVMKDIVDQGSTIALHTYTHDYSKLYDTDEAYFEDLAAISDLVKNETGVTADVIRFPGGSSNGVSAAYEEGIMSRLVEEVQRRGYQYFDWNVDSTDASGNNVPPATLIENAKSGIGMDEVCILMHDTGAKNTTVEALPSIIEAYRDAGYIFRGLTRNTTPVHHTVNN